MPATGVERQEEAGLELTVLSYAPAELRGAPEELDEAKGEHEFPGGRRRAARLDRAPLRHRHLPLPDAARRHAVALSPRADGGRALRRGAADAARAPRPRPAGLDQLYLDTASYHPAAIRAAIETVHYVETDDDFAEAVDAVREHPLFKQISAKLDSFITPYDPETWQSPKDAQAREFYRWDPPG